MLAAVCGGEVTAEAGFVAGAARRRLGAGGAPDEPARLRREVLGRLADEDTVGFGIHFADVPFGRVQRVGDSFAWSAVA